MKKTLTIIAFLLVAGLTTPSYAFYQTADWEAARDNYDAAVTKRTKAMDRIGQLQSDYEKLLGSVRSLKNSKDRDSMMGRLALETALKQSKSAADQLGATQESIRRMDRELMSFRRTIVSGLDQELSTLEGKLSSAPSSRRVTIVRELNTLRKRRSKYAAPLPTIPNVAEIAGTDGLDDPNEMLALADELDDAQEQLGRRADALESKIGELKASRDLVRRAKNFEAQENFFDEAQRARVVAKFDVVRRGNADGQAEAVATENDPVGRVNQDDGNGQVFAGADSDNASDPGVTNEESFSPPAVDDTVQDDPFEISRTEVTIDGGVDATETLADTRATSSDSSGRIRSFQKEQKSLRNQAKKLRQRAKRLRQKAQSL